MKKIILTVICLIVLSTSCFAAILDPFAPLVYYYQDTGLLLLDTNGWVLQSVLLNFTVSGEYKNNYFDNSLDNPLFEPFGGPITGEYWTANDVGESITGSINTYRVPGFSANLAAWGQISSGLTEADFNFVRYNEYVGVPNNWDPKYTNVIIVPEPVTMLLWGLGGIALARRRRG